MTERAVFSVALRLGARGAFLGRLSSVWPEMLRALEGSGWNNCSIYLHPADHVIGFVEAKDIAAAVAAMKALEVNDRWRRASAHLFDGPPQWLPLAFDLEEQLRGLAERDAPDSPTVRSAGTWPARRGDSSRHPSTG